MGQVVLLQQLVEGVAYIVGGVGVPVLPGEHVLVVYVVLAEVVAVVLLLLKQDLEQPHRIVGQRKTAEAGFSCGERKYISSQLQWIASDRGNGKGKIKIFLW